MEKRVWYTVVKWLALAPGEQPGGHQVVRETLFWDADGDSAGKADERAAALRLEGFAPTTFRSFSSRYGHINHARHGA